MGIIARIKGEEPGFFQAIPHLAQGKGHFGEFLTEYALEHGRLGDADVFSNVLVPRSTGPTATSEIDIVMLHAKGILVFESKNYSGWIFGSKDQQNWTVTFKGGARQRFYNPLKQNRSHVKALAAYLDIPARAFRSYIAFSERCELKSVPADTVEYCICRRPRLLDNVREDLKLRPVFFDEWTLVGLRSKLQALANASSDEAKAAHVEEVRRISEGEVCPWCGSELVPRTGKYGAFMGCSAYPRCRFTRGL